MSKTVGFSILAAGQGTRLKLDTPKPLVEINGRKLMEFPLKESQKFAKNNSLKPIFGIVVGHGKESVIETFNSDNFHFPVQEKQLGTADALKSYFNGTPGSKETEYTVVLCADTPLIRAHHIETLYSEVVKNNLDGAVATFTAENPYGYGRILTDDLNTNGFVIREEKDASDEERKTQTVNSGFYILKTSFVLEHLFNIKSENKSGEFYLTDLFQHDFAVRAVNFPDEIDFMGVNDLKQLQFASFRLYAEKNDLLMEQGVRIMDARHTFIEYDVEIGAGTIVYHGCHIFNGSIVGENCIIEPGCFIKNSTIASNTHIKAYSYFERANIGSDCAVGPFARLREGSNIGDESKIGNFVETKKANLEKGVKVSHLSYVGDAEIGENVNIGCGFITCNYDGANKHLTKIGKDSFIGSDTQMIAPINIGEAAYIGSGSTINQDVPDGAFAIARGRQVTKEGMAKKFIKKK